MGFLEAIFAAGATVIKTIRTVNQVTKNYIARVVNEVLQERAKENQATPSPMPVTVNIQIDIKNIDLEETELEKKRARDGLLKRTELEKLQELKKQREDKFEQWQKAKTQEVVAEQAKNPDAYETSFLNNDKAHILQFHMGQVVLEKQCGCGRPMFLQHKNRPDGSLLMLNDFFWSCIGYYNHANTQCRGIQKFSTQDIGLMHKANVFELKLSNAELSQSFTPKHIQITVVDRVRQHLKVENSNVLCPIHHMPMVLREKRNHSDVVIDMFYLQCPHFGCQQLVKLKSAAQIAAFLHSKEGRGIL
ncbi:MAG: hypothetical protein V7K40_23155 [Nostoc sp.]|uniref:hypothetical protein n=1 Tax=Nostoc sp. TaxID=1180 RepID=UPI002FFA7212